MLIEGILGGLLGTVNITLAQQQYYATKEEAISHVPTYIVPQDCFVWKDGSDPAKPWRVIPGTGCAHWVAHELGLGIFPSPWQRWEAGEIEPPLPEEAWYVCYDGFYINVGNVIAGRTEVEIKDAKVGDIWTNDALTHCGIVRQVGEDSILVEHCSNAQGGVVQTWYSSGKCWGADLGWVVVAVGDVSISGISGYPHYGDPVNPGDRIVIGGGRSLVVMKIPAEGGGTRLVTIGPNSDITLSFDSTTSTLAFEAFKGKVFNRIRNVKCPSEIRAPQCVSSVRGTEFLLETTMGGWIRNPANDHYYRLTEGQQSWLFDEAQAVAWGGHLVTINDEAEELWLRNTFGADKLFFIGLNDIAVEGEWGWVSGEPVTWTNWCSYEPNNGGYSYTNEDAGAMNFPCRTGNYAWNDLPAEVGVTGIVEVPEEPSPDTLITALEHSVEVSTPDGTESVIVPENHAVLATAAGLGEPHPIDPGSVDRWWELMSVTVASPVDLYVTDPLGRHVGTTPDGGIVNEIPDAEYTGPDASPEEILIPHPAEGSYDVTLLATGDGHYTLGVQALGVPNEPLIESHNGTIQTGESISYSVLLTEYPVDLTISSTAGGNVTTPGEGTFTYGNSTVVDLVAQPDDGYHFVTWTGNVSTIVDVEDASTTITMEGDYEITAKFEEIPSPPEPSGCFIATAVYGTPMAKEIQTLRDFRDEYLLTNPLGQAFVDLYYKLSPPIANFITDHPSLKPIVRAGLVPAVVMSTVVVNTTVTEKMVIIGSLMLVSMAVAIWVNRRHRRDSEYT